ncbi:MAG: hypothetical protein IKX14_02200, partial [Neisseriaceae bacterium]|nr:hypothetical protein [Neisseriaceae bacterium]
TQERIVLSGVNPENNQRREISDTSIKVMSVESIAKSIEDGRQEHQRRNEETKAFPDETARQEIDKQQDALEKRLMSGTDKLKLLTPPDAPPEELNNRYAVAERKGFVNDKLRRHRFDDFYTKRLDYIDRKDGKTVAFSDKGNKLSTSKSDQQTVADMLQVAKAKGWTTVKLRGSKEFKRQAYIEAAAMGFAVKGYSPTPQDLAFVEARKKELGIHSIEEHKTQAKEPKQKQPEKAQEQPKTEKQHEQQSPQAAEKGGILLAHGKENYHFNKANNESYFATIQNPDGTKNTLWGRDIERAIKESGAEVGDRVSLQKLGVENVRVREVVRDKQGEPVLNAVGVPKTDEHLYQRNQYAVTIHEKAQVPQEQEDLPQERLIKHDLMGQPEKNPAELSQKVDEAIFGKRPDEDASVARKGVYTALKVKDAVTIGAGVAAGGVVGGAAAVGFVAAQNYAIDKGVQTVENTFDIESQKQQAQADIKQMFNNPEQPIGVNTPQANNTPLPERNGHYTAEHIQRINADYSQAVATLPENQQRDLQRLEKYMVEKMSNNPEVSKSSLNQAMAAFKRQVSSDINNGRFNMPAFDKPARTQSKTQTRTKTQSQGMYF